MCVSCGCKKYDEDHGDKRHITMKTLETAASAAGVSTSEVGKNIDEALGTVPAGGKQASKG